MGARPSVPEQKVVRDTFDASRAHDELKACDICGVESVKAALCHQCLKWVCENCCQHNAEREQSRKNPYFAQQPIVISNTKVPIGATEATYCKVRSVTTCGYMKLAFICQMFYKDRYCKCCETTSEWKLIFSDGSHKIITKRLHKEDTFICPGAICYSEIKRELYMTVPCKQKVFKISPNGEFHEAFETPFGSCFGITCFDKGLAVAIQLDTQFDIAKWQIHLLDFKGNIRLRIQDNNIDRRPFFSEPKNIASNCEQTILHVWDQAKISLMAFNNQGDLLWIFADALLQKVGGMSVDMYGNIYAVCGKKLIQIDSGEKKSHECLTLSKNVTGEIADVCFDNNSKTLWTVQECGKVVSFNFRAENA